MGSQIRRSTALALSLFIATGPASGNVLIAEWNGNYDFEFQVQYMPDLDQKRWGLIDGGDSYCVPTATMNLFSYIAEWGLGAMDPGPGVYTYEVDHLDMTNHIWDLAWDMETTWGGCSGTCSSDTVNGIDEWIDPYPLVRYSDFKREGYCPNVNGMALIASTGALINFAYGRYNHNPSVLPVIGTRTGGHAVTMVYAHADGVNDIELWVRDPNDDPGDIFSEAPWAYRLYDPVEEMTVQADFDDDGIYEQVKVTGLEYDDADSQIRFIDSMHAIYPGNGFEFDEVELNVHLIGGLDFVNNNNPTHFNPAPFESFRDAALHPAQHSYYVLTQRPLSLFGHLKQINRVTGQQETLLQFTKPTQLAVGRFDDIYVATGSRIHRTQRPTSGYSIYVTKEVDVALSIQDMLYDDAKDEVVAVSTIEHKLVVAPRDLGDTSPVWEYPIPTLIPPSSEVSLAMNPNDGKIWLLASADPQTAFRMTIHDPGPNGWVQAQPISLSLGGDSTGLDFDDRGHLLVTKTNGSVLELEQVQPGVWFTVSNSRYANLQVDGEFHVARSRSSYDPAIGSEDIYIPSSELPEIGTYVLDDPPPAQKPRLRSWR